MENAEDIGDTPDCNNTIRFYGVEPEGFFCSCGGMSTYEQNEVFSLIPKEVCYESFEYLKKQNQHHIDEFEELKSSEQPHVSQTLTDIYAKYQQCEKELNELENKDSMRDATLLYKTIRSISSEIKDYVDKAEQEALYEARQKETMMRIKETYGDAEFIQIDNAQKDFVGDKIVKVVLIGGIASGKSSIISKSFRDEFSAKYISTIGVDFAIKMYKVGDKLIKIQLWDTAGQDRFRPIVSTYSKNSNAMIFVYDITDKVSFEELDIFVTEAKTYNSATLVTFLVGNKLDLEIDRQVTDKMAMQFANKHKLDYVTEVSCKSGFNISKTIEALCRLCLSSEP